MPQTLLAVLAMAMIVTFSMGQHRAAIDTQQEMINTEMEVMARAVGSENMRYVLSRGFDRALLNKNPAYVSKSALTDASDFGLPEDLAADEDCWSGDSNNCRFVEHLDGVERTDVFEVISPSGILVEFPFEVAFEVDYVNDEGEVVTGPEWTKRITVTVSQEHLEYDVIIERVVSSDD